jgi:type III restriction enzyme
MFEGKSPWQSQADHLNMLGKVSEKKDKAAMVCTACNLWISAVTKHGGFGYWALLEIENIVPTGRS